MSSANKKLSKRYSKIIMQQCKRCEGYKPKTKNQCKVFDNLLRKMEPDLVRQENKFLKDEGLTCKGYRYSQKAEDIYAKR